jgi:hypothetical protein
VGAGRDTRPKRSVGLVAGCDCRRGRFMPAAPRRFRRCWRQRKSARHAKGRIVPAPLVLAVAHCGPGVSSLTNRKRGRRSARTRSRQWHLVSRRLPPDVAYCTSYPRHL